MSIEGLASDWKEKAPVGGLTRSLFFRRVLARMENLVRMVKFRKKSNALQLQETLALGEKRFLAVVDWAGESVLIGVTAQSITLLKSKEGPPHQMRASGSSE